MFLCCLSHLASIWKCWRNTPYLTCIGMLFLFLVGTKKMMTRKLIQMNQCIIVRRDLLSELILVQGNIYGAPSLYYQSVNHCCKMSVWESGKEIYEEKNERERYRQNKKDKHPRRMCYNCYLDKNDDGIKERLLASLAIFVQSGILFISYLLYCFDHYFYSLWCKTFLDKMIHTIITTFFVFSCSNQSYITFIFFCD